MYYQFPHAHKLQKTLRQSPHHTYQSISLKWSNLIQPHLFFIWFHLLFIQPHPPHRTPTRKHPMRHSLPLFYTCQSFQTISSKYRQKYLSKNTTKPRSSVFHIRKNWISLTLYQCAYQHFGPRIQNTQKNSSTKRRVWKIKTKQQNCFDWIPMTQYQQTTSRLTRQKYALGKLPSKHLQSQWLRCQKSRYHQRSWRTYLQIYACL